MLWMEATAEQGSSAELGYGMLNTKLHDFFGLVLSYSPIDGMHFRISIHKTAVGTNKGIAYPGIQTDEEIVLL